MHCSDSKIGALLLRYELQRLGTEQELEFEAHLLECDSCFADLKALSRVGAVLRRQFGQEGTAGPRRPDRRWRLRGLAVAAVLLLAVAVGFALSATLFRPPSGVGESARALAQLCQSHLDRGNITAAEAAIAKAVELSPKDPSVLASAAHVMLLRGETNLAIEMIREAEARCGPGSGRTRCEILLTRALIQVASGLHREAVESLSRAAGIASEIEEALLEAVAWTRRGRILLTRLLDREEGRRSIDRAWKALGPDPPGHHRAIVEREEWLFAVLVEGDYEKGLSIAERIQRILRTSRPGDFRSEAAGLAGLGLSREALAAAGVDRKANLSLAGEYFREALELRRQARDLAGIAEARGHIGRAAILSDDLLEALRSLRESENIRRHRGDVHGGEVTRANQALVHLLVGNPEVALSLLEPIAKGLEDDPDPFLLFNVKAVEGRALLALGRAGARTLLAEAVDAGRRLYQTPVRRAEIALLRGLLDRSSPQVPTSPNLALSIRLY